MDYRLIPSDRKRNKISQLEMGEHVILGHMGDTTAGISREKSLREGLSSGDMPCGSVESPFAAANFGLSSQKINLKHDLRQHAYMRSSPM